MSIIVNDIMESIDRRSSLGADPKSTPLLPRNTSVDLIKDELENDPDTYRDPEGGKVVETKVVGHSSPISASFNFVNVIVGSGIIGLPFAVAQCGFVMGLLLLVLVALATDYSVRLLIRAGVHEGIKSYEAIMEHCYGKPGFIIISLVMFLLAYGAMISYMILIGQTIPSVTGVVFGMDNWSTNRRYIILMFGTIVVLPLCLLRDMGNLSYTSFLSISADTTIVILVLVRGMSRADEINSLADNQVTGLEEELERIVPSYNFIDVTIFGGIGAMAFAFVCHHSAFVVYSTIKDASPRKWDQVAHISVFIAFSLCFVLATFGYLTFFNDTEANILNNFDSHDAVINVGRILLAVTMFFTFPMEQFVARHVCHAVFFHSDKVSNLQHYGLTLCLWGSAMGIALLFDDLGVILELTGSVSASLGGYVLPMFVYFRVFGMRNVWNEAIESWDASSEFHRKSLYGRISAMAAFVVPIIIAGTGIIVFFIGTFTAIYKAVVGHDLGA